MPRYMFNDRGQEFSEVPCAEFGAWLETLAEHALTDSICSKWLKSCYIILHHFTMFHYVSFKIVKQFSHELIWIEYH